MSDPRETEESSIVQNQEAGSATVDQNVLISRLIFILEAIGIYAGAGAAGFAVSSLMESLADVRNIEGLHRTVLVLAPVIISMLAATAITVAIKGLNHNLRDQPYDE